MVNIFCEGVGDQIFIADFIEFHFNITFEREELSANKPSFNIFNEKISIISLDGCKKLKLPINKERFIENTELGGENIIVFDADYLDKGNGNNGFLNCKKMLDNLNDEIKFEYFLWPDHENDGYLEDVQRKMIPQEKEEILTCIETHFTCLNPLRSIHKLKEFDDKSKIAVYLHYCQKETQASKIRYNDQYWDLTTENNDQLHKFKIFLEKKIGVV